MKWILILIALIITSASFSQQYLVLKKRTKVKAVYEVGDKIKIRFEGEKYYTNQMITGFGDDFIRFHYADIQLSEITDIKLSDNDIRGFNPLPISRKLISAGILYLIADQFNQTVIRNEPAGISQSTAIVSGSFVTTGLLLKLLNKKHYNLNHRKFRLEIIDYLP